MMLFSLPYNRKAVPSSVTGTGKKNTYTFRYDDFGHKVYYKTGEKNLYKEIQEALPATNIMRLLARYEAGDRERLNLRPSVFADVSEAPKTLVEALNMVSSATMEFNKMPLEIRQAYNFSVSQFLADYGSENMQRLISQFNSKIYVKKNIPEPTYPEPEHVQEVKK